MTPEVSTERFAADNGFDTEQSHVAV
jgi:hypothetical protein